MSDAMVSVLDALDDPRALQGIRDEVLEMDLAVKRHMDRGLTPDEWAVAQAVREATQAALHSMALPSVPAEFVSRPESCSGTAPRMLLRGSIPRMARRTG